jgi:peptide methionine sulfoxide reductase MsrB
MVTSSSISVNPRWEEAFGIVEVSCSAGLGHAGERGPRRQHTIRWCIAKRMGDERRASAHGRHTIDFDTRHGA